MNASKLFRLRAINFLKTLALILSITSLTVVLALITMGKLFAAVCLVFVVMSYFLTPKITPGVLLKFFRAKKISYVEAPAIHRLLYFLSKKAGLISPPELYLIRSDKLLAFTTGDTEKSGIAVTSGLLTALSMEEIAGVLGHELSHITNNDVQVMLFALVMNRATGFLSVLGQVLFFINLPLILLSGLSISWMLILLLVFAPTLGYFIQLTLSRVREYSADLGAAELLGTPEPLISALRKIEYGESTFLGNLFFRRHKTKTPSFLMTHPPTKERIRRLKAFRVKTKEVGNKGETPSSVFISVPFRVSSNRIHNSHIKAFHESINS